MYLSEGLQQKNTVVLPLFEGSSFPQELKDVFNGEMKLDLGFKKITVLYTFGKCEAEKIIVVGLGDGTEDLKEAFEKVTKEYKEDLYVCVNEACAYQAALGLYVGLYDYKNDNLPTINFSGCEELVNKGKVIGLSRNHARKWSDTPSNIMTPEFLAKEACCIAKENNLEVEVLDREQLEEMGAELIVAVNKGSGRQAHIITVRYNGNGNAPYVALVGKGLTYDAGGYNIKTQSMIGMKYDMSGAANVLAIVEACAKLQLPINVKAVIGTTENKIGPMGYVEGDVFTSLNGKTVEVTNTDAEGRLVLADTMTYAQKEELACLMDMATLTGSAANALAHFYTAAFTNNVDLLNKVEQATEVTNELVWRMPLDQRHHQALYGSQTADMMNCNIKNKKAGCSTAAAFLEEFIENNLPWIHFDISGTGLENGVSKGIMIETLVNMLERGL